MHNPIYPWLADNFHPADVTIFKSCHRVGCTLSISQPHNPWCVFPYCYRNALQTNFQLSFHPQCFGNDLLMGFQKQIDDTAAKRQRTVDRTPEGPQGVLIYSLSLSLSRFFSLSLINKWPWQGFISMCWQHKGNSMYGKNINAIRTLIRIFFNIFLLGYLLAGRCKCSE